MTFGEFNELHTVVIERSWKTLWKPIKRTPTTEEQNERYMEYFAFRYPEIQISDLDTFLEKLVGIKK